MPVLGIIKISSNITLKYSRLKPITFQSSLRKTSSKIW